MTAVVGLEAICAVQVVVGVDTHQDEHMAVAIDQQGVRFAQRQAPASSYGYRELERWSRTLGEVRAFGVEGTGSYGAGLARFLSSRGFTVVEVNRPDRSTRYRKGKSDPTDASACGAGRGGQRHSQVRRGRNRDDPHAEIRQGLGCQGTHPGRQPDEGLGRYGPAGLRETLDGLTATAMATRCKSFPGHLVGPAAAAKYTLRSLACRYLQLDREIRNLQAELERLTRMAAPGLVDIFGVGPDTAAALLISAGSNPQHIHSEAAFAALCGVNPIPASSGKTNRHRLNRGGDRQANAALYRVVLVRLSHDLRTREYMHRRTGEGMSKTEVIRCLKRYVRSGGLLGLAALLRNTQKRTLTSIGASVAIGCSLFPGGFSVPEPLSRIQRSTLRLLPASRAVPAVFRRIQD